MPVLASAKKALRRDRRRATVNRGLKDKVRAALKNAREKQTAQSLREAYSAVDRAAKKGVLTKNKAARLKSRLMGFKKRQPPAVAKVNQTKKRAAARKK